MIGLGTMGSNLLQNIADNGYPCAGYDVNKAKVDSLNNLNRDNIHGYTDLKAFIDSLTLPRRVMMLVPAGKIVDEVIAQLLPLMDKGDIIIDGGNSHFTDTERRAVELEGKGFHFVGMGVSGGEEGARRGPSMMPGGDMEAYEYLQPILEKIAAHVDGEPTVAFMGDRSAGHFVKMVHNGIEYAIMQLISEAYEVMKNALKMEDAAIYETFKQWNEGELQSFLIEITRDIFNFKENGKDTLLLNDISDAAKALGTGKWTSQAAMDLSVPTSIIDVSVSMRDLSSQKSLRIEGAQVFPDTVDIPYNRDAKSYCDQLEGALYFGMIAAYAQGMHLLYTADKQYKYNLNLDVIAKIWRGGCIIRSLFLQDIYAAYNKNPELVHLFFDEQIGYKLKENLSSLRTVVTDAVVYGISVPAFSATISYFDNFRKEYMPTNLVQAQRDYFGAHTYELIGREGVFHTDWTQNNQ